MATAEGSRPLPRGEPATLDRLDSWKEIASYLRRGERTVRRWERARHLPVHRLPGSQRASVFAMKSELDEWWRQCGQGANGSMANAGTVSGNRRGVWLWIAGALLLAAALAGVRTVSLRSPRPAALVWKRITFDTGYTSDPAVSRDGKLIVYASDRSGRGDLDIYMQPQAGGAAKRLTWHEARNCRPDISPDGSLIAFHSYRDGGGIYVMPVTGGDERRIAAGDYPRFSPDGTQIAFDHDLTDGTFAIFIAPTAGGPAKRITPPLFLRSRGPLWSPDGNYILFTGSTYANPQEDDWWAVAVSGGRLTRTGVSAQLVRQGFSGLRFFHTPQDWLGNEAVFFYSANLWRIPLSPGGWQVTGLASQLTSGAGFERQIRVAAGSARKLIAVASAGAKETHLWEFAIDSDQGIVEGGGRQLTNDTSMLSALAATRPSLSTDGDSLVYASRRTGSKDIWLQDLRNGKERRLSSGLLNERDAVLAPDGSAVVFMRPAGNKWPLLTVSADGNQTSQVCDDCGSPTDWSADRRFVLYTSKAEKLGLVDLKTGARVELPSSMPVLSGTFSPDGRTVAIGTRFGQTERAYLVPFENGRWPSEQNWILLSDLPASAVIWSPGGNLAYFLSIQDEYRCLWAQRLDPITRQLIGRPFVVKHFHSMRQYPQMARWVAVARNRLVVRLTSEKSNIWSSELN